MLVNLLEILPGNSSLSDIGLCLEVEYARDSLVPHLADVIFSERICAEGDVSVADFVEVESAEEVGVGLVYHSIDDPDGLGIFPLN